jgi:hypothetical protein
MLAVASKSIVVTTYFWGVKPELLAKTVSKDGQNAAPFGTASHFSLPFYLSSATHPAIGPLDETMVYKCAHQRKRT